MPGVETVVSLIDSLTTKNLGTCTNLDVVAACMVNFSQTCFVAVSPVRIDCCPIVKGEVARLYDLLYGFFFPLPVQDVCLIVDGVTIKVPNSQEDGYVYFNRPLPMCWRLCQIQFECPLLGELCSQGLVTMEMSLIGGFLKADERHRLMLLVGDEEITSLTAYLLKTTRPPPQHNIQISVQLNVAELQQALCAQNKRF